jgi:hypothetical protein
MDAGNSRMLAAIETAAIASNFANLEASKMLFLFEKIKLRMKN